MKQLIISLGRESGSGGHEIAEKLAQRFSLPVYDKNLLQEIAKERPLDTETLRKYEEAPRNRLLGRSVRGLNNSMQASVFAIEASWLRKQADSGASFVIVGRCAESVLADCPGLVSLFISGDPEARIARLQTRHDFNQKQATDYMLRQDKRRRAYHDENCTGNWGDAANYHLTVSSTPLGIEGTTDLLEHYIRMRMGE